MKKHNIFKTNPHLKEVHSTSDGELFYNENDAKMHAKTLDDKKVELIVNPDLLEVTAEIVSEEDEETDGKVIDISKFKKDQLIQFAKDNNLELDPKLTNAQMVDSIEAQLLNETEGVGEVEEVEEAENDNLENQE